MSVPSRDIIIAIEMLALTAITCIHFLAAEAMIQTQLLCASPSLLSSNIKFTDNISIIKFTNYYYCSLLFGTLFEPNLLTEFCFFSIGSLYYQK